MPDTKNFDTQTSNALSEHIFYFHNGEETRAYNFLGAHIDNTNVIFRVWAPNAKGVSVVGDFNGWDNQRNPMMKISDEIWETTVNGIGKFTKYKY